MFSSFFQVMYLDHVDFSHRRVPDTFPRIEVWKQNMIRDFSDLDLRSPSVYGMRPLLDFEKTCYNKVFSVFVCCFFENIVFSMFVIAFLFYVGLCCAAGFRC